MYQFPIGVMLDSFRVSLEESLKAAVSVGAQGFQLYTVRGEMAPWNLDPQQRKDLKAKFEQYGLKVSALCGDFGEGGFGNPQKNPDLIARSKQVVDLAVDLGTDIVTTHIGVIPEDPEHPRYKIMQEACKELADYAQARNVHFAIETGPEKAITLKKFLDSLHSTGMAVNLDPANFKMVVGDDPVQAVYTLKDYIVHTHAKDGIRLYYRDPEYVYGLEESEMLMSPSFAELPLGEGDVDFPRYLKALEEIGYRGFLTIEREVGDNPYADIEKAVNFLKETIDDEEALKPQFKFAATTYSFMQYIKKGRMTQLDCIAKAKELGFDGIDFIELIVPEGMTKEEYAKAIRAEAQRVGIEISGYTIGANLLKGKAEVDRLKKELDICALMGARIFRHDATFGFKTKEERGQRGFYSVLDEMAGYAKELTEYAKTLGIRTCTENHGTFSQESSHVEALINKVADPNYGWLVDIGNFLCADEDPAFAVGVAAPYAVHVHAKDFVIKSGNGPDPGAGFFRTRAGNYLKGTIVGHGNVPVYQCLQTIKRSGYKGYVAVEFEGMEDCIEAMAIGLENIKKYLGL